MNDKITAADLIDMLHKQDAKCALSGISLAPETAIVDHITAVAAGGRNTIDNLQILHVDVNRMKNTLSNDRFIELCRLVAQRNPSIQGEQRADKLP